MVRNNELLVRPQKLFTTAAQLWTAKVDVFTIFTPFTHKPALSLFTRKVYFIFVYHFSRLGRISLYQDTEKLDFTLLSFFMSNVVKRIGFGEHMLLNYFSRFYRLGKDEVSNNLFHPLHTELICNGLLMVKKQ